VRVARALGRLPLLAEALAKGELSYAKIRALTRVATPETQPELLHVARQGTAAHVERIVRGWRYVDRRVELQEQGRHEARRTLQIYHDDDGSVVIRGRVAPEVGALLLRALEAAKEALYQRARREAAGGPTKLSNLALLCRRHHRAVHEGGYDVHRRADGALCFQRPDGSEMPVVPPPPPLPPDPVAALKEQHAAAGVPLDGTALQAKYLGEKLDLGYAIDVLHPAARSRPCTCPASRDVPAETSRDQEGKDGVR
jgi:hypothetical protein